VAAVAGGDQTQSFCSTSNLPALHHHKQTVENSGTPAMPGIQD